MTFLLTLFHRLIHAIFNGPTGTNFFVGYPNTNFFVFHLTVGILYLVIAWWIGWDDWVGGFVGSRGFSRHRVTHRVTGLGGHTGLVIRRSWFRVKSTPNLMPKLLLSI